MECIGCCTIAHQFRIDSCASRLCMLQFLENYDSGTLTKHEATSVFVKRNGCPGSIFCFGKCCKCCKTAKACWCDSCFCSTCHHNICIRALNGAVCFSNAVGSCCTGSYNINVLSAQSKLNGNISGCHIGDQKRNHQRIQSSWSLCVENFAGFLYHLHTSDTASHAAAYTEGIFFS